MTKIAFRKGSTASEVTATDAVKKVVFKYARKLRVYSVSIPKKVFSKYGPKASATQTFSQTKKLNKVSIEMMPCACSGQSFACSRARASTDCLCSFPSPTIVTF